MLKYNNYAITFAEVPDEVCLYITFANCPIRCNGCNSKHLWEDIGVPLKWDNLNTIIHCNTGITCVVFGGGDNYPKEIDKLAAHVKKSTSLKVCWYSGQDSISKDINVANFDYIKVGHFNGTPINKEGTNQIMYQVNHLVNGGFELINITNKFQKQ